MMLRLALFLSLLSLPAALACPVKAGHMAGGLIKDAGGTTPICGPLYLSFKQSMGGAKWTEMYALAPEATGQKQAASVLAALQKQGYRLVREKKSARSEVYLYRKGQATVTALIGLSGPTRYLALAGQ